MIEEIRVENLGVIASARVPLGAGLTAITGETGAGKTMLLTGLGLLLGGRADTARVRTGSDHATAEGCFVVPPDSAVADRAREAGAEVEPDGTLTVLRTVAAGGRSRAYLGGRTVPQGVLAELAEHLVTVHGQSDQVRLRSASRQRAALDAFAGAAHLAVLEEYRHAWAERQRMSAELAELVARAQDRTREAELLRVGLAEVERIDPQPGEDVGLVAEVERLGHAEDLRAAADAAHLAMSGSEEGIGADGAVALVDLARRALEPVVRHDELLAALAERLAEVEYTLADLGTDLARYADQVQADPGRLAAVQDRRAELTSLTRAHTGSIDDVLAWASWAGLRVLELEQADDRAAALGDRIAVLQGELERAADAVAVGRAEAARALADAVTAELGGLAMPTATFHVELRPADELGPWGREDVAMLLAAHTGAPALPLGQGASGGELSRVMLAIEVALATAPGSGAVRPPTFVFDEVDSGVGGKAAVEVGRRLAELARLAQVVVVTHLPQVAAFADHHVVVSKSGDADVVTVADVRQVSGDERVSELARMLSGQEDSATALQHAAELLQRSVVGR
jgi:DNA repair protein RecN (Recombination protein N)